MLNTDVAIIGAGPVGLFAIFQAGMLGMKSHIIDSQDNIGGQCSILYPEKPIYDIPAYPKILAGDLITQLSLQANPFKPTYHLGQQVISLQQDNNNHFILTTSKNTFIKAKAVIIAAGCGSFKPNKPPIDNINEFENRSVFYSVTNQANLMDKKIVIAGGGDSAVDWAICLSEIATKIYLVHRRAKFKASPENIKRLDELVKKNKIELVINYQLDQLNGQNGQLNEVIVRNLEGQSKNLMADILLPFFGLAQEIGPISTWGLNLHTNHINVELPYFNTNIAGIYACGDIAKYNGKLKLIMTGFAEVASSLHHSYSRVFDGKALHFEHSTSKGINN